MALIAAGVISGGVCCAWRPRYVVIFSIYRSPRLSRLCEPDDRPLHGKSLTLTKSLRARASDESSRAIGFASFVNLIFFSSFLRQFPEIFIAFTLFIKQKNLFCLLRRFLYYFTRDQSFFFYTYIYYKHDNTILMANYLNLNQNCG